jgi:hypothetical protein
MIKNNFLKFFRNRKKAQLKLTRSYSKGFDNSIRNYENLQFEEERNRFVLKFH